MRNNTFRLRTSFLTGLVFLLTVSLPVSSSADKVDDYIKRQMTKQHIPGLSLAIVHDGAVVKAKGYGLADVESNVPAKPETVYQLASMTKQFVAAGIMLLVQDGKLGLDDPISRFIANTPDTWKEITLRHLLTHTSGLKDHLNELPHNNREDVTAEQIARRIMPLPLNFPPGSKWSYCNTGYLLLALVVQKVTGKTYDQFLAERVFKPLGMNVTRRIALDEIIPNRAHGYIWDGKKLRNSEYTTSLSYWSNGEAGIVSSVLDLAKWDEALYSDAVLTASSREQMWTPVKLTGGKPFHYGFGWFVDDEEGHKNLWHTGHLPVTATVISRYPDDRLTIIMLTNKSGAATAGLPDWIAHYYLSGGKDVRPRTAKIAPDQLKAYTGYYDAGKNSTLSCVVRNGRFWTALPGEEPAELLPESPDTFFFADDDNDPWHKLRRVFARDAAGQVKSMVSKKDGKEVATLAYLGPLVHDLTPRSDPDPALGSKIETVLRALAGDSKTFGEARDVTPGFRRDFAAPYGPLEGLKSLTFIAEQDVSARGITRHDSKVSRIRSYRFTTDTASRCLLVCLTADSLLTDLDDVDD